MSPDVQRKLTTILAADAEGYSRVMQSDELRALGSLKAARAVFARFIQRHHGRIANTAGDGLIAEFPSVVEAVQCAIEVQQELGAQEGDPGGALHFRIGIHLGDVLVDGNDLLGEGVNLAARLQAMAEPGGILISQQVFDQVHAKLSVGFDFLGEKRPRNYSENIRVYRVSRGPRLRGAASEKQVFSVSSAPSASKSITEGKFSPRNRMMRHAALASVLLGALVAVDLATGSPFWAHYPGIVLATLLGLYVAPLLAEGTRSVMFVRGGVLAAGLVLMNLATWSGYLWSIWPVGVLALVEITRRLRVWRG